MPFDADDLAVFYDEDMPGHVLVESVTGSFDALMRSADADVFNYARVGTHRLRCLLSASLAPSAVLTIGSGVHAGNYVVHGMPRRINGAEAEADLVRQ